MAKNLNGIIYLSSITCKVRRRADGQYNRRIYGHATVFGIARGITSPWLYSFSG